ncbi:MAG TPA: AAA family ATPase [Chitinophaga sp.]|uniref:AAA family ATPase n=1 Tax=Chitinophaga sp. TaxID=1869181 RepID=UPI002DB718EE|nr:AAA family ATPase [Chitinophaga sp.]HEU4554432.1 AAA family ATPase [Chitinophaga sp.]
MLIIITGRPGSGKSTLARQVSDTVRCPLVSRDQLKEGYIRTARLPHNALPENTNRNVSGAFFQVLASLAGAGISAVAEAAFQHTVWEAGLAQLEEKAGIVILLCKVSPDLALQRFNNRLLADPEREKFHGDQDVRFDEGLKKFIIEYKPPGLPYPTLEVDTTNGYTPGMNAIMDFIGIL